VSGFSDHFSGHAANYTRFRPGYPRELFDFLAALSPARARAWDCATGGGQAALALAERFEQVVATDASPAQVAHAAAHPRVGYAISLAEHAALRGACADLVTVAQALHWFDLEAFYGEVERVLRPGGAIAAWCYGLMRIAPTIDAVVEHLYYDVLAPWWPAERRHIDAGYLDLPFPFIEVPAPALAMRASWTTSEVLGYLSTWSAVQRCIAAEGSDPLAGVADRIAGLWGDPERAREITWPLGLRAGLVRAIAR